MIFLEYIKPKIAFIDSIYNTIECGININTSSASDQNYINEKLVNQSNN